MRRIRFMGAPFLLFGAAWLGLMGSAVWLLWNRLMPVIFHLPAISFGEGLGLLVLSRILFGGFRGGWKPGMGKRRWARGWKNLTPEERERFREAMKARCGRDFERKQPAGEAAFEGTERQA